MSLPHTLYEAIHAHAGSGKEALLTLGAESLTYDQLHRQAEETREQLEQFGLRKGDRVAIAAFGADMGSAILSVAASSAAAVPMNASLTPTELLKQLSASKPKALIAPQRSAMKDIRAAAQSLGIPIITMREKDTTPGRFILEAPDAAIHSSGEKLDVPNPEDTAIILSTSGTTSMPKMVPHTHASLCEAITVGTQAMAFTEHDRVLNYLPLSHSFGLCCNLLLPIVNGASTVFAGDFMAGKHVGELVKEHNITTLFGAPPMFRAIRHYARIGGYKNGELNLLKNVGVAGSPVTGEVVDNIASTLPNASIYPILGSTEALFMAIQRMSQEETQDHRKSRDNRGFVTSKPTESNALKIVNPETREEVAPGETGELLVRSKQLMHGYLPVDGMDVNGAAFDSDGYFKTGDLVAREHNGVLYHRGRCKDLIKVNARQVAPAEVEEVICTHPDVKRAVVFGIPHSKKGETVGAVIELSTEKLKQLAGRDLLANKEFMTELNTRLGSLSQHKHPVCIVLTDELPTVGALQKISRSAIPSMLGVDEHSFGITIKSANIPAPADIKSIVAARETAHSTQASL